MVMGRVFIRCGWGYPHGELERNLPSGCDGNRSEFSSVAEVLKSPEETLGLRLLGSAVEVIGSEIGVEGTILEHVVDGGEEGGGNGTDRLLGAASSAQALELS